MLSIVPFFGGLVALAVNFLLLFTFWFVIDKHLAPVDAMKASYQLVTANLSTTILFYLLSIAIFIAGAIALRRRPAGRGAGRAPRDGVPVQAAARGPDRRLT